MPQLSFVADEDDFTAILAYLNDHPDIAFIVADGPGRWRAVRTLDRIDIDRIALWHIPSGPLPLPQSDHRQPDQPIQDPWRGWNELRAGADGRYPWFGPGHPGVFWLQHNPKGPGTSHGVGISLFEWIGDHYSVIGRPASPATEKFWTDLRRWLTRQTMPRGSAGDSRAFPSAMAKIRAAEAQP